MVCKKSLKINGQHAYSRENLEFFHQYLRKFRTSGTFSLSVIGYFICDRAFGWRRYFFFDLPWNIAGSVSLFLHKARKCARGIEPKFHFVRTDQR
jgi:hypothetical protein